jgi:hypothetical protein
MSERPFEALTELQANLAGKTAEQILPGGTMSLRRIRGAWMRLAVAAVVATLLLARAPASAEPAKVQIYKSPTCGCCQKWVDHLKSSGYDVSVSNVSDVGPVKRELGVPQGAASCHTALVGGYFVEGHVPAEDIARLLAEHPDVAGLAVPGMPLGSPGMEGPNARPYKVFAVKRDGTMTVFAEHTPR